MLWKLCMLSQYFSVRLFKWQYLWLSWRFNRSIRQRSKKQKNKIKLLNGLYQMVGIAIMKNDEVIAYQTLEMLKLSFGENLIFHDESGKLMNLCALALQKKQYTVAGYILDTYKPFIKNTSSRNICDILQGLILLINIAKKLNQEYILGKSAKCVFEGILKLASMPDSENSFNYAIDALKTVGLNAIKSKDCALFQHTTFCVLKLPVPENVKKQEKLYLLLSVWMHQIVKRDNGELLQIFIELVDKLVQDLHNGDNVARFIVEQSDEFIGIIGVNHKMQCKMDLINFLLKVAGKSTENMRRLSYNIGRMAKITISLHGMKQGFEVYLPLLEVGRNYLNEELKFMKSSNEKRLKILFLMMNELALVLEIVARQDGRMSSSEVLMTFKEYWLSYYKKEANRKSVNQFCQLLLKQMIKARKRKTRNLCINSKDFLDFDLFDTNQIKKLGLGS